MGSFGSRLIFGLVVWVQAGIGFAACAPDGLDDQRDGPLGPVEVGDGQRHPLAVLVEHHDDELPWFGRLGHQRMADFQQERDVGEILAFYDFKV